MSRRCPCIITYFENALKTTIYRLCNSFQDKLLFSKICSCDGASLNCLTSFFKSNFRMESIQLMSREICLPVTFIIKIAWRLVSLLKCENRKKCSGDDIISIYLPENQTDVCLDSLEGFLGSNTEASVQSYVNIPHWEILTILNLLLIKS